MSCNKMLSYRGQWHVFVASIMVFLILNTVENLIHYNIGRHSGTRFNLNNPSFADWQKIILTMILFACLQGMFTLLFEEMFFSRYQKHPKLHFFMPSNRTPPRSFRK